MVSLNPEFPIILRVGGTCQSWEMRKRISTPEGRSTYIILFDAFLHYFTARRHRPLVLYLDAEMQTKFIAKCEEFECLEVEWPDVMIYKDWWLARGILIVENDVLSIFYHHCKVLIL